MDQLYKDAVVMALHLWGEDRSTMSPEVIEVMERWDSIIWEQLTGEKNDKKNTLSEGL